MIGQVKVLGSGGWSCSELSPRFDRVRRETVR